jgi:hypothetical protein
MLNWRVKIVDPSILSAMINITRIQCEQRDGYFVFKPGNLIDLFPYKKCLKQFRLPNIMIPYVGKEVKITRNFINAEPDELFRIEPVNFSVVNETPYFTQSHFYIPQSYIHKYLDERAPVLRMSLIATNQNMIQEGTIHVFMTEEDTPMSSSVHQHRKSLRAKLLAGMHYVFSMCASSLSDFEYVSTTEKSRNFKYGTMIFKRRQSDG